jgi:dolichol-phosphate mannosyltransferase
MEIKKIVKAHEILIAIPTYNESKNIKSLILEILENNNNIDLLILDDSSPDGTGLIVEDLKNKFLNLHIIYQAKKSGIGNAHINALKISKNNNYSTLITMDADLTHEPKEIKNFLSEIENSDAALVVGSRFINQNSLVGWSISRKFLTHLGHLLTRILLLIPYDATGGYRAYSLSKINNELINSINEIDYEFFFESITIFHKCKLKIKEIPIVLQARGAGKSKMSYYHVLKGCLRLLFIAFKLQTNKFNI